MTDLFWNSDRLEYIPLPGAEIYYQQHFDLGDPAEIVLSELIKDTPWRHENITVWGKTYKQPRLVAWFGDTGRSYIYSGISLDPLPWTSRLTDMKRRVEKATNDSFNSVLLNYYRDNEDSMGMHSDDERELGQQPIIASVSLGAERPFIFKSRLDASAKSVKIILRSGSLLLMKGNTQHNYKHGIEKERRKLGPRVNLTFRTIVI